MIVAGFDPGSKSYGIGLIAKKDEHFEFITAKTITLCFENRRELSESIWKALEEFCSLYNFDEAALEEGFLGKSVHSFSLLEQLRGITMGFFIAHKIPFTLYQPRMVKKSICGYGNASKQQIANILPKLVKGINRDLTEDESDALAIALIHLFQKR